jgi:hypothetical protein
VTRYIRIGAPEYIIFYEICDKEKLAFRSVYWNAKVKTKWRAYDYESLINYMNDRYAPNKYGYTTLDELPYYVKKNDMNPYSSKSIKEKLIRKF